MLQRTLGRTGFKLSVLSYGCGAVGGLMTNGDPKDQERAFARALELGIRYFDTAAQYGDGASERNVGRILAKLKPDIVLATKVRVKEEDYGRIGAAVTAAIEASLKRLGRDGVDIYHLHNRITHMTGGDGISADLVLSEVVPAFERLRQQGKTRFFGITALGDTEPLLRVVDSGAFDTAQVCYNALNPTAGSIGGAALPAGYPAQDYRGLLEQAQKVGMGTIGIRVLAGGALSGSVKRHPLSSQDVAPIGSAKSFATDADNARRLQPLVAEGHAGSLPELAMRFAISNPALSTTLVGLAEIGELETAAAAVSKGPLTPAALARLRELQQGLT